MAEKSLKIALKSDLRDGQKLSGFLKGIQTQAEKLVKTLGAVNIGGAGPGGMPRPGAAPGQQGLSKQLVDDKRGLESMGREVENLDRRFRSLSNTVASAATRLRAVSGPGLVDQFGRPMGPSGGGPAAPGGPGGTGPGGGAPGAPGAPGGPSGFARTLGGFARMAGWGTVIRNLSEAYFGAPQRQIDWASVGAKAGAGGNAAIGGMGARMMGGDMMPGIGLMRAMGVGKGFTNINKGDLQTIINTTPEAQGRLAESKGLSLNFVRGIHQAGLGLEGKTQAAAVNAKMAEMIEAGGAQDSMQNQRIQMAQSQAGGRVGFARQFGKDFNANIPLGANVDPQQTMATVTAVLSVLGTGATINKVTDLVVKATRAGISNEAIQTMLRAQEVGGGNILGRVMGSGLSRPMMGAAGVAAAGFAQNSLMALGDTGTGGFTSGGAGTNELTMRRLNAGVGLLGQMTTGQLDPYQSTINAAIASKPGRSVYVTQTLMSMSPQELLHAALSKEGPTQEQLDAGVTRENAKAQLNGVMRSIKSRGVRESGITEGSAGVTALLNAPDDFVGAIKGSSAAQRRLLGVGFSQVTGQQLGAGTGALDFLEGETRGGKAGKAPGTTEGRFGTANAANLANAKDFEKESGLMKLAMDDLGAVVKAFPNLVKGFSDAMTAVDVDSAIGASTSLMGVGSALGEISKNGPAAVDVMTFVQKFVTDIAANAAALEAATTAARAGGRLGAGTSTPTTTVLGRPTASPGSGNLGRSTGSSGSGNLGQGGR